MKPEELNEILKEHKTWLGDSTRGERAILSFKDFPGADLRNADLRRAYLACTCLTGADLNGANLEGANLWGAELRDANLGGVELRRAFLGGTDLRGADLSWARLTFADLEKAKLEGASLKYATFYGARLKSTKIDYQIQKGLLKKIAKVVLADPQKLDMGNERFNVGVSHCLGNHAFQLSETARKLRMALGYEVACLLTLGPWAHSMLSKKNEEVLDFLRAVA